MTHRRGPEGPREHFVAVLAELQRLKSDAESGIKAVERILASYGHALPQRPLAPDQSISARVLRLLKENPHTFSVTEIRTQTGSPNYGTLRGILGALARKGRIKRVGYGRYKAV